MKEKREKERESPPIVRGGVSQAVIGLERERYITSHPPKTVSTYQDHSLKECHPKWVSRPQMAEKLSLKCVAENEGEKREKMMIGW